MIRNQPPRDYAIAVGRLTAYGPGTIVACMTKATAQQAVDQDLKRLEFRVEELIRSIDKLKEENRSLRARQDSMTAERAQLIERNELARTRVEAMINRLKAMESA